MNEFRVIALTPAGHLDPSVAVAASRAGEMGVLNLEHTSDEDSARNAIARMSRFAKGPCGLKVDGSNGAFLRHVVEDLPESIQCVILTPGESDTLSWAVSEIRGGGRTVLLEATTRAQAEQGVELGVDGLVAKGSEAGGWVGEETTFVLLQELLRFGMPVWAHGGIGLHTAAGAFQAGAAGVVLDAQLYLARESRLRNEVKDAVARMDGSETVCLGGELGMGFRLYTRNGQGAPAALRETLEGLLATARTRSELQLEWRKAVRDRAGWGSPDREVWPLGQDGVTASTLSRRFRTVGGILAAIRDQAVKNVQAARNLRPLDEKSPLAESHRTRYPIVQGPMTRVSDRAEFAFAVAEAGGLPFLALALMREGEVEALLQETQKLLGSRPWGVGILGFVPLALREEQLRAIRAYRPPFALIAGGRPDQARGLDEQGISTYLHVPAPGLLRLFLEDGMRRFVLEGRECGGHVGPRSSFVLWESMIDVLLESLTKDEMRKCHVLFAGGIHDDLSASMVAAIAAPLAERGARVGVLMGTAYLFTKECVTTGAIVEGFQKAALQCDQTVLLESGPGHATRCADTAFVRTFLQEKGRLLSQGKSSEQIRNDLEELNIGRLRIASKGIARHPQYGLVPGVSKLVALSEEEQRSEGLYMVGQVAALRDHACSMKDLHHQVAVEGTRRLESGTRVPEVVAASSTASRPSEIAIVGMACILPQAPDLQTYWENILNKVNAIREIPHDRWDWKLYYDPDPNARDKIYSKWGGFLDEVPFDPVEFGMPPNSLASIDPMQLLALKTARGALQDAGYLERSFDRRRTSVILGASGGTGDLGAAYVLRSTLPLILGDRASDLVSQANGGLPEWTEDSFAGLLLNVAAGRIANRFDLGGLNYVVDAACASSLTAVHLAVKELETGNSEMVIVGGVDTVQNPFGYLCFSKTRALSPTGKPRTFDASADGIAISEGIVMLVLKRLADAERDGDRIYAVIQGVGGSSDGRAKAMTAPRPEGQTLAFERAYAKAGIAPRTVGLFEAHGTGTVVGDQAEAKSLSAFLESKSAPTASAAVGSVKSMIGHTKATAGVAGLAKVALALYHKILPPTWGVEQPNPNAHFGTSPLYINSEARPWIHGVQEHPRRAGVSAFGFGGTNFHAVVEEYTGEFLPRPSLCKRWTSELFYWSFPSRSELVSALESLVRDMDEGASPELGDLAYSLWRVAERRPEAEADVRLAIVGGSRDDFRKKLSAALDMLRRESPSGRSVPGVYLGTEPSPPGRVAFVFPGQGSQYPNMLRDLAVPFGEVREAFERFDRWLAERFPERLSSYIFPIPAFGDEEERAQRERLMQTNVAQPALGAAAVALLHLLRRFGVEPDLAGGHSYGEYVGLMAAGVFSEETLARLSEARGRFIIEAAESDLGTMAAVRATAERISQVLGDRDDVWIANRNAPEQTMISGSHRAVDEAVQLLKAEGISARVIPVACAFHSPIVEPAQKLLAGYLSQIDFELPRLDIFSNTTAAAYPRDPRGVTALLAEHLVRPVRFAEEIEAMYEAGARIFVEVGPNSVLAALIEQTLGDERPHLAVSLDKPGRHGLTQLQHALAELAARGVPVRLDPFFEGRELRSLNLESLAEETKAPSLSPTTWLVNGGHARPLSQSRTSPKPSSLVTIQSHGPSNGKPAGTGVVASGETPTRTVGAPNPETGSVPSPTPLQGAASEEVMVQFQNVMGRFLETQRNVMLAYLQGEPASSRPSRSGPELSVIEEAVVSPAGTSHPQPESPREAVPEEEIAGIATGEKSGSTEAPADREHVKERLLQIVSERTGYPPDMLNLDMDIEADLGIDSIKRVEILGTVQRACLPAGVQVESASMERLTGMKTLGGILEWLVATLKDVGEARPAEGAPAGAPTADAVPKSGAESGTGSSSEEESTKAATHEVPRSILVPVEAPSTLTGDPGALRGRVVLITEDGRGVAEDLAARLRESGARVAVLRSGPGSKVPGDGIYECDLGEPSEVRSTIAIVRERQGPVGAVVHLAPLRKVSPFEDLDLQGWRDRLRTDVKGLFHLAQAAAADLKDTPGGARLLSATLGKPSSVPSIGGLDGLTKTLALEWPAVGCRTVHFEVDTSSSAMARRLLDEMGIEDGRAVVEYRGDRRLSLQPELRTFEEGGAVRLSMDSSWTLLVTGGARGITAEVACHLAGRYRPQLIVAGKSPMPEPDESPRTVVLTSPQEIKLALVEEMRRAGQDVSLARVEDAYNRLMKEREIRRNLKRMEQAGSSVRYVQVDVRDETAMAGLTAEIYEQHGRLDGVIAGAGIIEDKLIENKTPESFDRVFDTKVESAFILSRHLRPESLRFLAFFASAAGTFGNRGQCDYAAANEILSKLAAHLDDSWPGRVVAMAWGPWLKTGMVSPELRKQFSERGVELISIPEGCRAFDRELTYGSKGESEVVLAGGAWGGPASTATGGAGSRLPLLAQAEVSRLDHDAVDVVRSFDPSRDVYLRDHRLDGRMVVPVAVAMELMAEVACEGWPRFEVVGIRDLNVLKGVILEQSAKRVQVTARRVERAPESEDGELIKMEIRDPATSTVHYRALVEIARRFHEAPPDLGPPDGGGNESFPMSVEQAYREWLFHGPSFQGIKKIVGIRPDGMTAYLSPSVPQRCLSGGVEGEWLIDPVLFDSGLQLVILWARNYLDMTPLPARFRRYRRFRKLSGSDVRCHLRVRPQHQEALFSIDLDFLDEEGRLAARLEDMECPCSRQLNRLAAASAG